MPKAKKKISPPKKLGRRKQLDKFLQQEDKANPANVSQRKKKK